MKILFNKQERFIIRHHPKFMVDYQSSGTSDDNNLSFYKSQEKIRSKPSEYAEVFDSGEENKDIDNSTEKNNSFNLLRSSSRRNDANLLVSGRTEGLTSIFNLTVPEI